MYIVQVDPFSKSLKEPLSYFSNKPVDLGKIVTIPLRNQKVKGLVLDCVDGINYKQELKDARYQIKKISGLSANPLLNKAYISTCQVVAEYFITTPGAIIKSMVPKTVLDNFEKFQYKNKFSDNQVNDSHRPERYIIQTSDSERYSEYKSLVRNQFAKNKSVFFCVPTIEDALYAHELLSKGIEKNSYIFHSKINQKNLNENWVNAINSEKPVLIICTGNFLCLPRHDIGFIIVERENSKAYKAFNHPYFDIRRFAETYAQKIGAVFLLGDLLLRAETLWRYDEGELMERGQIKFRFLNSAKSFIIDMKNEAKILKEKRIEFPIISERLADLLKKAQISNEQSFLLVSRKGLYPSVVCGDCAEPVLCADCNSPMVLYGCLDQEKNRLKNSDNNQQKQRNFFRCHHCNKTRDARELCQKCGSWKLKMLGIGIDGAAEKIKKIIPAENIYVLDKDKCKTTKQAHDLINSFLKNPSGVLIGTEMALLYLKNEVENVAVISIDSMLSIPDFQINERIVNILLRAKSKAINNFFIQTRNIKNQIFESAIRGNLADFYRQEFIDRKKFLYPPFSFLIKIKGCANTRSKIEKDFEGLKNFLRPYEIQTYVPILEQVKGKYFRNGLIKLSNGLWPDQKLSERLKELPRQFSLEIDSDSIF